MAKQERTGMEEARRRIAEATWAGYFVFQVVCAVVTGVMSPATGPRPARFALA